MSLPVIVRPLAYRELPAPFGRRSTRLRLTYTKSDHHISREMPSLAVLRCALRPGREGMPGNTARHPST